jgi:D-serine deaminase-like pyridoxal phosphate-dependent protein
MGGSAQSEDLRRELIGSRIEDLDTPALLLDRRALEGNLRRMADFFADRTCRLRPHFKSNKCTELARRQLEAGSLVGFTCAKLGEAEVLAAAGFDNLLIANQVVGRRKVARLAQLAGGRDIRVAIDHPDQATTLSEAAVVAGATIGVLVEVDIGMGRCGVGPGEPAVALARQVAALPGLRFDGLQAYEGHLVYLDDHDERARRVREAMGRAVATRQSLEQQGIAVSVLSGGSSATYKITGTIDGVDEVQAGSYATMDWRYGQLAPEFDVALSVLTRVISRRADGAVLDVGVKGVGAEFGPPRIMHHPDVEIPSFLSEEHCVVRNTPDWSIGEPVHLLPSHGCTTCNLYRQMHVHEDGRVVDVWSIDGSGEMT